MAEIEPIQQQATDLIVRARELRITNPAENEAAVGIGRQLREIKDAILNYWNGTPDKPGPVAKAYDAWKSLTAKRAEMVDPLQIAIDRVARAIVDYEAEQRRIAAEAQRKAEEDARLAREAEIAAELAAAKAEGAKKAELRAMEQSARAVPVAVPVVSAPAKPAGLSVPRTWKCKEAPGQHFAFIQEVGRLLGSKLQAEQRLGRTLAQMLVLDESQANRFAKATNGTISIPGLEFYQDAQVRFGARR